MISFPAAVSPVLDEANDACPICGGRETLYSRTKSFLVFRCGECELLRTNFGESHEEATATNPTYFGEAVYFENMEQQKERFRKQLQSVAATSGRKLDGTEILEVGCGFGFFLDVCEEAGMRAVGIDISKRAIENANRKSQRASLGTLDSTYPAESVDAVFAWNLIEHLPRPKEFLVAAQRVLRPGGLLVLETPIQNSLFHRIAQLLHWLSRGRISVFGLEVTPGGHIFKFSRRTFKTICKRMGFTILHDTNISSPYGEIVGKSSIWTFGDSAIDWLYRLTLPSLWVLAYITGLGNRAFVILRKQ